ncbi:MAG: hypothetical protein CMH57_09775 [Myxococcales bacterium]|nr:hypothetical protein [Myxococcales bacterium]
MDPSQPQHPPRRPLAERLRLDHLAPSPAELHARLQRTAAHTWERLARDGRLHPSAAARPTTLAQPRSFTELLCAAVAVERSEGAPANHARVAVLEQLHLEWSPSLRVETLTTSALPSSALFHTPLQPERLPRLTASLDRLFDLLTEAGLDPTAAIGAPSTDALLRARPTLGRLYTPTYFGGCMPMLYASPADLDAYRRELEGGGDLHHLIDHRLAAPLIHEYMHMARERDAILPPYLDECLAGYLGVRVLPGFAWPSPGHDNALFGSPWFAQVGQAMVRAFGLKAVLRAHTGADPWGESLPGGFADAAERIGWSQYLDGRQPHLLAGNTQPEPWLKATFLAAAGHDLADASLDSLARVSMCDIPPPEPDPMDDEILADALRTMCLRHHTDGSAHRIRLAAPSYPIAIDLRSCRVGLEGAPQGPYATPTYLFPPTLAAALRAQGLERLRVELHDLAALPEVQHVIQEGRPASSDHFTLTLHPDAP